LEIARTPTGNTIMVKERSLFPTDTVTVIVPAAVVFRVLPDIVPPVVPAFSTFQDRLDINELERVSGSRAAIIAGIFSCSKTLSIDII